MTHTKTFELEVIPRDDAGSLIIRFIGDHSLQQSQTNRNIMIEKYNIASWPAIIYNLTEAEMSHSILDFKRTAKSMNEYIAKPKIIAHVFFDETLTHAMLMSRLLQEYGFMTGAFRNEQDALDFIKRNLSDSEDNKDAQSSR